MMGIVELLGSSGLTPNRCCEEGTEEFVLI